MLTFLASLTVEQQAALVAAFTFGIVWLIKRSKLEWTQDEIDKQRYYVQAVTWALLLAAIQNAGDWDWRKWLVAAIMGFLGSQGLYTTSKAVKRLGRQ